MRAPINPPSVVLASTSPELSDLTRPSESGHMIGSPKRQRLDGHRGLTSPGRDKARAITDEQVRHVVGTMIFVRDRERRIVSHAASTEQMDRNAPLRHLFLPDLLSAGRRHDVGRAIADK